MFPNVHSKWIEHCVRMSLAKASYLSTADGIFFVMTVIPAVCQHLWLGLNLTFLPLSFRRFLFPNVIIHGSALWNVQRSEKSGRTDSKRKISPARRFDKWLARNVLRTADLLGLKKRLLLPKAISSFKRLQWFGCKAIISYLHISPHKRLKKFSPRPRSLWLKMILATNVNY